MGKIRTDMEKLVKEVRSSASARHAGIKHLRERTRSLLTQDRHAGRERAQTIRAQAKALGTKLARQSRERVKSARELKTGLGRVAQRRKTALRKSQAGTSHRLSQMRLERGKMAVQLRQSVLEEVNGIRAAVGALKGSVRATMGGIAADVAEATRLWRGGPARRPAALSRGAQRGSLNRRQG